MKIMCDWNTNAKHANAAQTGNSTQFLSSIKNFYRLKVLKPVLSSCVKAKPSKHSWLNIYNLLVK